MTDLQKEPQGIGKPDWMPTQTKPVSPPSKDWPKWFEKTMTIFGMVIMLGAGFAAAVGVLAAAVKLCQFLWGWIS